MTIISVLQSPPVKKWIFAILLFVFAIFAFAGPVYISASLEHTGFLLVWAALIVFMQSFMRSTEHDRSSAKIGALITFLLGVILVNITLFEGNAVLVFITVLFGFDAFRQFIALLRQKRKGAAWVPELLSFAGNIVVLLVIFFFRGRTAEWMMAFTAALRIAGMGLEVLYVRSGRLDEVGVDVLTSLGLQDFPGLQPLVTEIERQEKFRSAIDRRWIIIFLLILFFIHLGRIGFDRSASGILSPFIALVGDAVMALIIAFLIIIPIRILLYGSTFRLFEKRLWLWVMQVPPADRGRFSLRNLGQELLTLRLRHNIRLRKSGYSFITAIRIGLQTGLPWAAILAAIIPVFGMSWYFDTENWAAGVWDSWAASRADTWREAMIRSVEPEPTATSFTVYPAGVTDTADFSFMIVGDPGEGDASQFVLSDQIIKATSKDDVKFLVISSDVVYPDGAMKDYEKKFWLPLKGLTKPVYAIPGNHDWYDALEGFNATFLDSAAARKAMQARRNADLQLTAITEDEIDQKIAEAAWLRNQYKVPTGFQQAPFFQVQTKDFAFISIETGVLRRIDPVQMQWLKQTLEASKGKCIFVLLGHPFYAAGEYQGSMNPDFLALHELIRSSGATVAMAGDTHDLEYYQEHVPGKDTGTIMHHFVNGGGGAYLSIGAALRPKAEMPEKVWAHYPAAAPLISKIDSFTGNLKRPAWYWTKKFNGWPFSAEWLSAAFDYNRAPFFQSFVEVRVEVSQNRLRIIPHGIYGRLTWAEIEKSEGVKPVNVPDTALAEWVFPLHQGS